MKVTHIRATSTGKSGCNCFLLRKQSDFKILQCLDASYRLTIILLLLARESLSNNDIR